LVDEHLLLLCRSSAVERVYRVALGKGGVEKRRANDDRTPLGAYPLGAPRPSKRFGTFIPIGYPTSEQKRLGYSGGGIGVHGPDRRFAWAGRVNTLVDWTRGCVAVGSDEVIGEVASWVTRERARIIHLERAEAEHEGPDRERARGQEPRR
jgi:murein L,D-transpeptidase YafK